MFFVNMAETMQQKLPPNKYGIDSVNNVYKNFDISINFQLEATNEDVILKLFKTLKFRRQQVLIIFLEDFKRMPLSF